MTATTPDIDQRDTVLRVNPAELTPHPANPRTDLGDLTDLIASITAHGVLEPVIVVPADTVAEAWPEHAKQIADSDAEYVTLLGHRRVAAAQTTMLNELSVVVRDDLTTADAQLSAMTAENVARADLTALEEAKAFHALSAQGWTQRRIAAELGCAQSHVSKRLKLLTLPAELQAGIAGGELDIADALTLGTLPDHGQVVAAWEQWREQPHWNLDRLVEQQRHRAAQEARRKALLDQAAAEGIEVVDPVRQFGGYYYEHELRGKRAIERARKDGTLVYAISWGDDELVPYSTTPPKNAENRSERQEATAAEQRERRRAAKARDQACPRLVADIPDMDRLRDLLAKAVLERDIPDANALKLAARWMAAADLCPATSDSYKWARAMANHEDVKVRAYAAWAGLIASWEQHARSPHVRWGRRERLYLALLRASGYVPTPWEQARIQASDTDSEAAEGCTDLACPLPGWHDGPCDTDSDDADDSTESAGASSDSIDDEGA